MIKRWLACVLVVTFLTAQVVAQPLPAPSPPVPLAPTAALTVLVLPIDGDADPVLRTALTARIEKSVQHLGTVKAGTTTLGETAAAIGCDPATPDCAESVRTTLAVDVLIYGTATTKDGQVQLVIRKIEKEKPPVEVTLGVAAIGEPPAELDPVAMRPLTGKEPVVVCPADTDTAPDGSCHPKTPIKPIKKARTDRALGIAALIGGGVLMIGGLTLWNEKSKKQDQIDAAPTETVRDFQDLKILEDDAGKKATYGNLMVLGALGATAVGIWLLRRDRKAQREAVLVTPTVTPTGAGVWITIGAH